MRSIRSESGAITVEFALAAPIFFYLVFAVIELSVKAMQQNELDNFMMHAYQELAISPVEAADQRQYLEDLCEDGPVFFLSCDDIVLGAQVVRGRFVDWRERIINGAWNYGCADDVVIIEMLYPVTNIFHSFVLGDVVTVDDDGGEMLRSRGIVRREPVLDNGAVC